MKSVIPADVLLRLDNVLPEEADSAENNLDGRIKRSIGGRSGRIFKRVLNENLLSSAENKKDELMVNGSRSLVVIFETEMDDNSTKVEIEETFPRKAMDVSLLLLADVLS